MNHKAALEIVGLRYRYPGGVEALRGVDLAVAPGECVGLVGPNGAGKTTLVLTLAGFCRPDAGQVRVQGIALEPCALARVRAQVGFVFQNLDDQLFMPSVLEDVEFGPLKAGVPPATAHAQAHAILDEMGLGDLAGRFPGHLSAGQKRLATLAAVLVLQPALLVLDEPTSFLDPAARRRFMAHLAALPQARLLVTHDLEMVLELCTRVVLLADGQVVATGAPAALLAQEALLAAHHLEVPYSLRPRR
jgi:energy-coupling factor transporter ATP-binding protein EcfA2